MNSQSQDQTEHEQPDEDLPDVTMTDSGEKEPGEDPDFDANQTGTDDRV